MFFYFYPKFSQFRVVLYFGSYFFACYVARSGIRIGSFVLLLYFVLVLRIQFVASKDFQISYNYCGSFNLCSYSSAVALWYIEYALTKWLSVSIRMHGLIDSSTIESICAFQVLVLQVSLME